MQIKKGDQDVDVSYTTTSNSTFETPKASEKENKAITWILVKDKNKRGIRKIDTIDTKKDIQEKKYFI
ncbi:MAG TPA: hypothetical protein VN704_03080 [Verrucomicrobiae bacterium]|nr:hypothetical protein [Verrucomicrobiae bacterium]